MFHSLLLHVSSCSEKTNISESELAKRLSAVCESRYESNSDSHDSSRVTSPVKSVVVSPVKSPVTSPLKSLVTSPVTSSVTSPIKSPISSSDRESLASTENGSERNDRTFEEALSPTHAVDSDSLNNVRMKL